MKGGYETPPHSFAIRSPMGNSKQRVYVSPTTTIPFLILLRVRARASRETVAERWIAKIEVDDFYRTAMRGKMFVEILVSRQPSRFRVSGTQARQSYLLRLSLFPILLLYYNFFGRFFLRACSEFSSLLLKHDFPRSNLTGNFFDAEISNYRDFRYFRSPPISRSTRMGEGWPSHSRVPKNQARDNRD